VPPLRAVDGVYVVMLVAVVWLITQLLHASELALVGSPLALVATRIGAQSGIQVPRDSRGERFASASGHRTPVCGREIRFLAIPRTRSCRSLALYQSSVAS